MRLIDADAFKIQLENAYEYTELGEVIDMLDNAPTVEVRMGRMTNGVIIPIGIKQGEWIDHSDEGYVECPFCGSATNCEDNKDELHYCWNCGAEMRQEETKDDG